MAKINLPPPPGLNAHQTRVYFWRFPLSSWSNYPQWVGPNLSSFTYQILYFVRVRAEVLPHVVYAGPLSLGVVEDVAEAAGVPGGLIHVTVLDLYNILQT